jgi:hypothetical protein
MLFCHVVLSEECVVNLEITNLSKYLSLTDTKGENTNKKKKIQTELASVL